MFFRGSAQNKFVLYTTKVDLRTLVRFSYNEIGFDIERMSV